MTDYIELYKKYRPRKWNGLIGQEKVAKSLRNAVLNNKIPTGFIFSGERGCGKTSAALLLAKSLNCDNVSEAGDPCNKCEICQNIDNGTQLGVSYISMANNGSAADVRAITRQAYLQQPIKRQIFILDEVHRISPAAFDALLIPFEDKSMKSLFILCTTEVNKIPNTISSRCQSRKFNLVSADVLTDYLKKIAKVEGLEATESDLEAAVRMGRGSVRDTLSSLDSILVTGEVVESFQSNLLRALADQNVTEVFKVLAEAAQDGADFNEMSEQLFRDLRDLLLISAGVDRSLVGGVAYKDEEEILKGLKGAAGINAYLSDLGEAINQMTMGADSRILLEVSLLKTLRKIKKSSQ